MVRSGFGQELMRWGEIPLRNVDAEDLRFVGGLNESHWGRVGHLEHGESDEAS